MKVLAEQGITAYDFLSGSSPYKQWSATRESALFGIQIWRTTLHAAVYCSIQLGGRAFQ
jgi:CelD/BcsL family acetyltransferase involved in cellulose biosynthesis